MIKRIITVFTLLIAIMSGFITEGIAASGKAISLSADGAYTDVFPAGYDSVEIIGENAGVKLTLPTTLNLTSDLKLDNLTLSGTSTIFANGYKLEITDTVASDSALSVYGGSNAASCAETDIRIYGGKYSAIYGGGKSGGTVTGNTNVIVGGNVNPGQTTIQGDSNFSPCYIYGGGESSKVSGVANVTLTGNAVTQYLIGSGKNSAGTVSGVNMTISGGKAMNVYVGSVNVALPSGVSLNLNMTGGQVESIFGGCYGTSITGNIYVNLYGGDVKRRVYTGCYNDYSPFRWTTEYYVTGTTTLTISPNVSLSTGNDLPTSEKTDMGIYAGSRHKNSHSDAEVNTIIYLDGAYSTHSSKIGNQDIINISSTKSHHSYVVKASSGGSVAGTGFGGQILLKPNSGKYAKVGSSNYLGGVAALTSATTTVDFLDEFAINSVLATATETGITADVGFSCVNLSERSTPTLYVAVYDESRLVSCVETTDIVGQSAKSLNIDFDRQTGKNYTVKAMMWTSDLEALVASKSTEL